MNDLPGLPRRTSAFSTGDSQGPRINVLSSKITSILSSSFADIEIRDALETLDERNTKNTADTRRNLRFEVQKEIIECNGEILKDFGHVAQQLKSVGTALRNLQNTCAAIRGHVNTAHGATNSLLSDASNLFTQKQQIESKQVILGTFTTHFLLTPQEHLSLTSAGEPVTDAFFAALVKAKRIHHDSQILLGGESQRLGLEIVESSTRDLNAAYQKLFRWVQREFKLVDLENPHMSAAMRRALRVLAERPTMFQTCLDSFAESRERVLSESFYAALTGQMAATAIGDAPKLIEYWEHDPLRFVGDMLAWVHSATVSEREALEGLFVSDGHEIAKSIQAGLESEPWLRANVDDDDDDDDDMPTNGADPDDYFSLQRSQRRKMRGEPTPQVFDGRRALAQLIDRALSGVADLLRQRISALIHSFTSPVLAYQTANLLSFYINVFSRLVSTSATTTGGNPNSTTLTTTTTAITFNTTLHQLYITALDHFRTTTRSLISATLHATALTAPPDLSPPEFLVESLDELTQLLKSYDTSYSYASAAASAAPSPPSHGPSHDTGISSVIPDSENSLHLLLTESLDPFLTACATLSRHLLPPNNEVFAANCLLKVKDTLSALRMRFLVPRISELDDDIEEHALALVNYLHGFLVRRSGLQPLLAAVAQIHEEQDRNYAAGNTKDNDDNNDEDEETRLLSQLASQFPFQPQRLIEASYSLDAFLPSALMDAAEQVKRLGVASTGSGLGLAREVVGEAAERFCVDFEGLEEWLARIDEMLERETEEATSRRAGENGGKEGKGDVEGSVEGGTAASEEEVGDERQRLKELFPRTAEEIRILLS